MGRGPCAYRASAIKSDVEPQDDDATTGQQLHGGIRLDDAEPHDAGQVSATEQHTGDELGENRRLA
jgi:hypothetical protein